MLIVSHDRFFLDRVVTQVFELHQRRIRSFPGNYHDYARLRRERHELELKEWESQREYIEKQEEYIRAGALRSIGEAGAVPPQGASTG